MLKFLIPLDKVPLPSTICKTVTLYHIFGKMGAAQIISAQHTILNVFKNLPFIKKYIIWCRHQINQRI